MKHDLKSPVYATLPVSRLDWQTLLEAIPIFAEFQHSGKKRRVVEEIKKLVLENNEYKQNKTGSPS